VDELYFNTPVQVKGLSDVCAIDTGTVCSLVLKKDGTVWAWGQNYNGAITTDEVEDSATPVPVENLYGVTAIAAESLSGETSGRFLVLKNDGTVWAWGNGPLGNGTNTASLIPVQVKDLADVSSATTGGRHSVAVKNDGTVWAWGADYSQLEYETNIDWTIPFQVKNLTDITTASTGSAHSLALKSDGTVWAWGENEVGQLGDSTSGLGLYRTAPIQVLGENGEGFLNLWVTPPETSPGGKTGTLQLIFDFILALMRMILDFFSTVLGAVL